MQPLIKWAGGKSSEIKKIEKMIPISFERYFEPFFGGGAVFFHLEPREVAINDISKELMLIYEYLRNGHHRDVFKNELYNYVRYWERIGEYMKIFGDAFLDIYNRYRKGKITDEGLKKEISEVFEEQLMEFNGLFNNDFCLSKKHLQKTIEDNLIAKFQRTKNHVDPQNKFSDQSIKDNIETAFRSGFYMHFREMMNKAKKGEIKVSDEKKTANYYFIREFCYGGMFRFNDKGEFNVPYGGMNYNKKNFRKKVDHLFSEEVRQLLRSAIIESMDFEEFLRRYRPTERDFIFLDPPYDTEFSEYEENPFTEHDQERLANLLANTKAKFILIIKKTALIERLYNSKSFRIVEFGKTYKYNIKSRFERDVKHLIIHNLGKASKQLKLTQST
jgi:DNA adenine methylase